MKRKINIFAFICTVILLTVMPIYCAFADGASAVDVAVNGEILEFDVQPFIENDRTLIPIRAVSEFLEYIVEWHEDDRCVEITDGSDVLRLYIDSLEYDKNGQKKVLDAAPTIRDGRTVVPLRLIAEELGCEVDWIAEITMVEIVKYKTVVADTPSDIISNIGNYTKIVLKDKEYNLSQLDNDDISGEHISKEQLYKGYDYVIKDLVHFSIEAEENAAPAIVTESSYASVLYFKDCQGIHLKGITAGHKAEKGYCTGGVIFFDNCADAEIDGCHLYGCGTYGITAHDCADIDVTGTEIYDCSYGLVSLDNSTAMRFDNCIFRNSQMFTMFDMYNCRDISFSNSTVQSNQSDDCAFIGAYNCSNITFENCDFKNNTFGKLYEGDSISLTGCNIN